MTTSPMVKTMWVALRAPQRASRAGVMHASPLISLPLGALKSSFYLKEPLKLSKRSLQLSKGALPLKGARPPPSRPSGWPGWPPPAGMAGQKIKVFEKREKEKQSLLITL